MQAVPLTPSPPPFFLPLSRTEEPAKASTCADRDRRALQQLALDVHVSILKNILKTGEARCSSVIRASAHGVTGRRIDSSQSFTTGITKAVICAILSVHINEPLLLIGKNSPCSGGSDFTI